MKKELLTILRDDVKPALGCTGPVSVIFAASVAAKAVGGELESLSMILDRDTYKNSISVSTPGTDYMGVAAPAVLGAIYGNPALGLETLNDMHGYDKARVDAMAENAVDISIAWERREMGIYIEVFANTTAGVGHAIVARTHDGVVLEEANGRVIRRDESYDPADTAFETEKPIRAYTVRDLYDFAAEAPVADLAFLKEAVDANYKLAEAGLVSGVGSGFGVGFSQLGVDSMYMKAKALAAAASDARMSGVALPAMSCGGSGNVGITGCVPLVCVAEALNSGEEQLLRALALSYLLIIMGKAHIGRLSPVCACALAAGIGVAAGACRLMGGSFEQIEGAINSLIGSIGGVLCDGAKYGCAMKLASAAGVAIECAELAVRGVSIRALDGIVGRSADETLAFIGRLASNGMLQADDSMCRDIIAREGRLPVEPVV